ncbi:hypothetical protein MKX42_23705 [Paenibacillus sp. FSL R7-0204]|uniref:hypothetical protein n=1 Tax=Paenibacillus sp. FSL R7-0204 TaxID=2921675 RepID=UPI0030F7D076
MECYQHHGMGAVAQCQECGKGLCGECSERFSLMLCEQCLLANNELAQRRVIISFAVSVLFAIIGVYVGVHSGASGVAGAIGYGYLGLSVPWGYSFFGKFIAAPYFKAVLALSLGWAIAPFSIYRNIKELQTIRVTKQDISANASV